MTARPHQFSTSKLRCDATSFPIVIAPTVLKIDKEHMRSFPDGMQTLIILPYSLSLFQGRVEHKPLVKLDFVTNGYLLYQLSKVKSLDAHKIARITNDACRSFTGLQYLTMSGCFTSPITDEGFLHRTNLHSLRMCACNQLAITDNAFLHLINVQHLSVSRCNLSTITDKAFCHFTHLTFLSIVKYCQLTDAAFNYFTSLKVLNMSQCKQTTITDEAFCHWKHLTFLSINRCGQLTMQRLVVSPV